MQWMRRRISFAGRAVCLSIFLLLPALAPAMSVTLSSNIPSPAPLATPVIWAADATDTTAGTIWYRFSSRTLNRDPQIIKDYGPDNTLLWTASEREGIFYVRVDARNTSTGEVATAEQAFEMQSRLTNGQPVISATMHPMVYLYSAPGCPAGSRMRVQFTSPAGVTTQTPYKACVEGRSMNFYVAGLTGDSLYGVKHVIETGSNIESGPLLPLATPPARTDLQTAAVEAGPPAGAPDNVVLHATVFAPTIATDLNGNLIWYYDGNISFLTRTAPGGRFFGIVENPGGDYSTQLLREFDLTGLTLRETNAARVNEQLAAMGRRQISGFHHEARLLPDGRILALAGVEQGLMDVQGPGPVDILGDMIVVLDANLNVVWAWDAFDHLDLSRRATLGDLCSPGACPATFMNINGAPANDWTHGNSVQLTPDGQLLYSSRSQDWVIKIAYDNGNGNGDILWRLGQDGDFRVISDDPSPWFSHQHDPQFLPDNTTLLVFDNGNVRNDVDPTANSRGQVWKIDENARTATLVDNFDLGMYSFALGAAQRLPNGNFHFDVGFLPDGTSYALSIMPDGQTAYALHTAAPEYRSFRMPDLYTAPYGTH